MSLVKNMDNWSDMSKLDLLYKFSIIKVSSVFHYSRIVWLKHLGNCVNKNKRNIYIYNYCSYNDVVSN